MYDQQFLTITKNTFARVIQTFWPFYNWNIIWFTIPKVQILVKYNCNYLFQVHLYSRLSCLWLPYERWQEIGSHMMHSLSPHTPLCRGHNHRTQRNNVMDNYFIICGFGYITNQFNEEHYKLYIWDYYSNECP